MSNMQSHNDEGNMSLVGHLREVRNRIALVFVALIVVFFACFAFIKPLASKLLEMGKNYGFQYVYLAPSEMLTSYFKLSMILAVVIVAPLLLSQIWGFVAPALTKREKRAIRPALVGGLFFFCLGAAFSYFVALPFMIQFLINYSASDFIQSAISVASYLDFMVGMLLTFGLVFELPMLAFVLTINQGIPLQGVANATVSIETANMSVDLEALLDKLRMVDGVKRMEVLGQAQHSIV